MDVAFCVVVRALRPGSEAPEESDEEAECQGPYSSEHEDGAVD